MLVTKELAGMPVPLIGIPGTRLAVVPVARVMEFDERVVLAVRAMLVSALLLIE